jgi:diguanylate cyclase (GGDEF)-like protein
MQAVAPTQMKTVEKDGGVDFFTGLPSQFSALTDINTLVMESKNKSESFALLLLGIDHFKELQSTLGPGFSNQIIKKIANYFQSNTPENMQVYRMDCDKFLFVLKNESDKDLVREAAKKLILDIKNFYQDNDTARLTTSIGISIYPDHGKNAAKLLHHVYMALDQAQQESESNIGFFEIEIQSIHKDDVKMNEEIRKGIKNHEFFLYYQPIFNVKSEEMIGAEALIRWKHPELGLITADKFLDVSKKTGLIVDLGEYVFREAIMQKNSGMNRD